MISIYEKELKRKQAWTRNSTKDVKTEPSSFITAQELINRPMDEIPMLAEGLIPKVGLSVLAGSSDLGKSAWARQLCLSIVTGEEYFCGFRLNPVHKSALFIASEDDAHATSSLLHKTAKPTEKLSRLRFCFDAIDLTKTISDAITEPVDLIVIDCAIDFFRGNMNLANEVRGWMAPLKRIAVKHEAQILLITHNSKRSEEREPHKDNTLGAGAFQHVPRLVLELRSGDSPGQRWLCILKGNFLPDSIKDEAHELRFEEMKFHSTGQRKARHEIVKRPITNEKLQEALQVQELLQSGKNQRQAAELLGFSLGKVNQLSKQTNGVHVQTP